MAVKKCSEIRHKIYNVGMLSDMLADNIKVYTDSDYGGAGSEYPKNSNASKTALLNQITTLRNELLGLAELIKQ